MQWDEQQVAAVARLARLSVRPDEMKRFSEQLSRIVTYVETLNELPLSTVEPTAHPLLLSNLFREDKVSPSLPLKEVMDNAPEPDPPFFMVPQVME